MDLGATEWTTFRKITLPMIAPGVAAAALLASAISIDDYVITSFNAGQTQTFPLFIFGATRQGVPPEVNVLATGAARGRADPDGAQRDAATTPGGRDRSAATCSTSPSRRRSSPHVASRRTGLVFDERCFGHRNPPSGPPWLAVPPFERPERLAATFRALEGSGVLRHLERMPAASAPRTALELVHDASHVQRVLPSRARRPGSTTRRGSAPAAAPPRCSRSAGCSRRSRPWSAGEIDNAFVLARPPGHHAEAARPMGFCLFNATAVAARWAQLARGAARVAILDWDVHHGNGTEAIFRDDAHRADDLAAPGRAVSERHRRGRHARRGDRQRPAARGHRRRRLRAGLRARRRARDPRLRPRPAARRGGPGRRRQRPAGADGGDRARLPGLDRARGRAGGGVLRRAARRLPRGRLLAAPPARREPRDRRGAGRACRRASRATRSAATCRRGCARSSAPRSRRRRRGAAGDPRRARLVDRRGGRAGAAARARGRHRRRRGGGRRRLHRAVDGVGDRRGGAERARRRARGRPLRHGAERAQRRLSLLAVAVPARCCAASTARRAALELCEASVESVRGDRRVVRGPGGRRLAPRGARISSSPAPPARTARAPARSTATTSWP